MSKNPSRDMNGSTSKSLIVRLKKNELPAWRELVDLYSPMIFYWCRRQGLPEQECSDVTQDVFRSVVSNIASFRKQTSSDTFRGWLRTVTRNKVVDHFRKNQDRVLAAGGSEANRRMVQTPDDDDLLVHDEQELQQEHALFMRAIGMIQKDFTEKTWKAFWSVTIDGRTAAEAANDIGMSSGAVRVAKSRVLRRLREQLGDIL